MDPEDLLEELERDVDEMEQEFQAAQNPDAEGTMREKQQRAQELIKEIHGQLEFLQEQVGDGKE
ncbi:MAG: hypothetical protein ABEJ91_01630 [Candidatus Nanohaloarchaea archaeon]